MSGDTQDEHGPSRRLLWPVARVSLNVVIVATGLVLVALLVVQLRLVVLPILIAVLICALLIPVADVLRRRGVPSVFAALASMLVGAGVVAALLALVIPAVADQIGDVGRAAEEGVDRAVEWLTGGPLDLDRAQIDRAVDDALASARTGGEGLAGGVVRGATFVGELVAGTLLAIVLVFFFLHDGRSIWSWIVGLFPGRHRDDVDAIGERMWFVISRYVRGVMVVALADALLIGLALVIIGVPLVVPLMALTFLGAFIPLVGAVLAGAVAALVALVSGGVIDAALVVVVITVIQQVEGDLLYPLVVGQAIALHPVAILIALTAGTVVAGLAGALLVIPVTAAAWAAIEHLRSRESAHP